MARARAGDGDAIKAVIVKFIDEGTDTKGIKYSEDLTSGKVDRVLLQMTWSGVRCTLGGPIRNNIDRCAATPGPRKTSFPRW